jgi:hypothetical protein
VRDDKIGGGNHFSAAEKLKGRIVDIIGLEERSKVRDDKLGGGNHFSAAEK